eukprot:7637631-Prorocentrum_lima.AAC.1
MAAPRMALMRLRGRHRIMTRGDPAVRRALDWQQKKGVGWATQLRHDIAWEVQTPGHSGVDAAGMRWAGLDSALRASP